jgi:quinoprotein glucose dehydrogenase
LLSCSDAKPPSHQDGAGSAAHAQVAGWGSYGGDPGGTRYSPLRQIDPGNVARLEVAWTYRTGDYAGARPELGKTAFQATPVLADGTLYLCTPANRIVALDAETGGARWTFDPQVRYPGSWSRTCRGVALWRDPLGGDGPCAKRVFMGTMDARLFAVDAVTGRVCADFGASGFVDLTAGLGELEPAETYPTSPPLVIGDVVVTGALVADNRRVDGPGGVVRGFDVRSGHLRWAFDPVPPGTPPLPPAADGTPRFHRGTPNAWSAFAADPERGLVYLPFGGPSPDFYGGQRKGFDYYGSSVVALHGESGRVVWRFQTVHHDIWDYDVASQPMRMEMRREGRLVPAIAQATKMGHIFLLDPDTGVPLFPVEERPVPQTTIPGEITSATQPFPTFPEPLHPPRIDAQDVFALTPLDRALCRRKLASLRHEGIFTPPSFEGSIQYPGTAGGQNWGSMAFDPERALLVMTAARLAQIHTVLPRAEYPGLSFETRPKGLLFQAGTPYYTRQEIFSSPFGVPCSPLPWGVLLAVDLETGKKRWEVPFGTTEGLVPGIPAMAFGLPSMGGPIATGSGLVIIGAAMDDRLRIYDIETGELLHERTLPAGAQATPITYRLRESGRQFVVIAAGGHSTLGTTSGDHVIAFALP